MTEDEAQRSRWTFYEVVIFILTYHGKSPLRIIIFYFSRLKLEFRVCGIKKIKKRSFNC
jgi:hypothetical protein